MTTQNYEKKMKKSKKPHNIYYLFCDIALTYAAYCTTDGNRSSCNRTPRLVE